MNETIEALMERLNEKDRTISELRIENEALRRGSKGIPSFITSSTFLK
jgi:hypothetical protein